MDDHVDCSLASSTRQLALHFVNFCPSRLSAMGTAESVSGGRHCTANESSEEKPVRAKAIAEQYSGQDEQSGDQSQVAFYCHEFSASSLIRTLKQAAFPRTLSAFWQLSQGFISCTVAKFRNCKSEAGDFPASDGSYSASFVPELDHSDYRRAILSGWEN